MAFGHDLFAWGVGSAIVVLAWTGTLTIVVSAYREFFK